MKGLLRKDFLLLNSVILPMIAVLVMFAVAGVAEFVDILYTFPIWSIFVITAIFNQDRFYRMDEFVSTIPDGKVKNIKSKYIMALVLVLVLVLITFGSSALYLLMHEGFDYNLVPLITVLVVTFTLLGFAIFLPLTYRFGIMRISLLEGMWAITGVFVMLFSTDVKLLNLISVYTYDRVLLGSALLLLATLCLYYVSYIVSIKIYRKRVK